MLKSFVSALALAATATAASAANLEIKTSDLDLTTEQGAKMLDQRIMVAARKLCEADQTNTGSRIGSKSSAECIKKAAADARQKLAALNSRASS